MSGRRIVVVEDAAAGRELFADLLEEAGFVVVTAGSAAEGIAAVRREVPALVLMDIGLPDMDGREALQVLRDDPALGGIPVVAVTAQAMTGDRDAILAAGFDGYIAKPVDTRNFAARVAGFLERPAP